MDLNVAIVQGRITRDPEMRYTQEGNAITKFGIAINRRWKDKKTGQDKEDVSFINIDTFGHLAEWAGEKLHKGDTVLVRGEIRTRSWNVEGEEKKRHAFAIAAETVIFQKKRSEGGDDSARAAAEDAEADAAAASHGEEEPGQPEGD